MTEATIISGADLAKLLGITSQVVNEHVRNGIIPKVSRGKFNLNDGVKSYCAHIREQAARAGRPTSASNDDLKAEKLRLTQAQADAQELKNKALRGDLVDAETVKREWASILRDVRASMLAVPSRYGAELSHLTPHDIQKLESEIKASLEDLANGND